MWKMVWKDFCCGGGNGYEQPLFKISFIYVYVIIYVPLFFHLERKYVLCLALLCLSMLTAMLLSRRYGGKLNKTLYLCPMSAGDRRKYWLCSWIMRAGLSAGLSLLLSGALLAAGIFPTAAFFTASATAALHATAINLYCPPLESDWLYEKRHPLPGSYEVWDICLQITGVLTIAFLVGILSDSAHPELSGPELLIYPLFAGHTVLAVCMIWKYFRPVLKYMERYESLPQDGKKQEHRDGSISG